MASWWGTTARERLGILYVKGSKGVKPDYENAYFWLSLGIESNFFREVEKKLTPAQRKAVDENVREWIEAKKKPSGLPTPSSTTLSIRAEARYTPRGAGPLLPGRPANA